MTADVFCIRIITNDYSLSVKIIYMMHVSSTKYVVHMLYIKSTFDMYLDTITKYQVHFRDDRYVINI